MDVVIDPMLILRQNKRVTWFFRKLRRMIASGKWLAFDDKRSTRLVCPSDPKRSGLKFSPIAAVHYDICGEDDDENIMQECFLFPEFVKASNIPEIIVVEIVRASEKLPPYSKLYRKRLINALSLTCEGPSDQELGVIPKEE
jgi:hypothetical protein